MILEAVLLGLSTGTYCAMYCGPVLVPFLLGTEKISFRRNAGLVGFFLASRLAVYFVLGLVLGILGIAAGEVFDLCFARRLSVYAYIFCGAALLLNSFGVKFPWGKDGCRCASLKIAGNDYLTAVLSGLAVGLHICAPLWTAIVRSVFLPGIKGVLYLVFFYAGTLPFFLPLMGIPFVQKMVPVMRRIARIAQLLAGFYFLIFEGLIDLFF